MGILKKDSHFFFVFYIPNPNQGPNDNNNDIDCDGVVNETDNCINTYNPYQIDQNNNGVGDACEDFPKIGMGTTGPKRELHLSNTDVYIDNPEKGIILKDNNGTCYKLTMSNGAIQTVVVPCPQ